VFASRVGKRFNRSSRLVGTSVRVDPDSTEVMLESSFKEALRCRIQGLAGRAQDVVNNWRSEGRALRDCIRFRVRDHGITLAVDRCNGVTRRGGHNREWRVILRVRCKLSLRKDQIVAERQCTGSAAPLALLDRDQCCSVHPYPTEIVTEA
jgi:hypothetical protein